MTRISERCWHEVVYNYFGLLRPIPVEHDPDHDHRADCDHHRADHRQLFEHGDNARPPAKSSLHMRETPACHTHSETPFGPQQRRSNSINASARLTIANSGVPLDQGEETLQPYCQGERCFLLRQPAADPPPAHELHLVRRIGLTCGAGRRSRQESARQHVGQRRARSFSARGCRSLLRWDVRPCCSGDAVHQAPSIPGRCVAT